jgi:serine acetyltransferase
MQSSEDAIPKRSAVNEEIITWPQARALIRSDFERLLSIYGGGSWSRRVFWFFLPSYQVLFWYRIYRYLYLKGWRNTARLLFLITLYLTRAEISPESSIGPGCFIGHAGGIILSGKVGARCALLAQSGIGGGLEEGDIGGGPGLPVVGDDVVFGVRSMALGPIRVGNRVRLAPAAFLSCDAPDDALVIALPSKVVKARTAVAEPAVIADGLPNSSVHDGEAAGS